MEPEDLDERDERVAAAVDGLVRGAVLEPVGDDDAGARRWMDCELCSFVANRFHTEIDPDALTDELREQWLPRALDRDECILDPRGAFFARFWSAFWLLGPDGARAGTLALLTTMPGRRLLGISSLFVLPSQRNAGLAQRALRETKAAAAAVGIRGISIETDWAWQRPLRLYLSKAKLWATSFKRSIVLAAKTSLPPHEIEVGDRLARFAVLSDGRQREIISAERTSDRLIWHEHPEMNDPDSEVTFYARSTFAVALAIEGWPLLRSRSEFDRSSGSDVGGPEVLAHRIARFEWWDRRCGFDVRTPRIPGLPYDEIARKLDREDDTQ